MSRLILSVLLLFSFAACGDYDPDNDIVQREEEESPDLNNFSKRLTNNLLVKGEQCFGGEIIEHEGQTYTCETNQWLVTVDNINVCNDDGCTEAFVPEFIARLTRAEITTPPELSFYFILPISPVSERVRIDLRRIWVRFDQNGTARVLFRQ